MLLVTVRAIAVGIAATFGLALPAAATPRLFPLGNGAATSAKGASEIEQAFDIHPVKAFDAAGRTATTLRAQMNTELEIGLTDGLELGIYAAFGNAPGEVPGQAPLFFEGLRQRLRYRPVALGQWPIDVAFYAEISELRNEIELEGRVILEKRMGPVRLVSNLWLERELYYDGSREWVIRPTLGGAYELRPWLSLGIEGFLHAELGGPPGDAVAAFNRRLHVFAGPIAAVLLKKVTLTAGLYARFTEIGRAAQVGDRFGPIWTRLLVGIDL